MSLPVALRVEAEPAAAVVELVDPLGTLVVLPELLPVELPEADLTRSDGLDVWKLSTSTSPAAVEVMTMGARLFT
jgi:hypothetical protein